MEKIVLGLAPTRRSIFSAPDAVKYADLTREKLREMGVSFVDITDIAEDGLLHEDGDRIRIAEKFSRAGVDGLFFPHGNFGTEYEVARLAQDLNVPVLLWGPRDERPDENGIRLRDSQCGLFATGKVLRRFRIPFTYLCNCRLEDPEFERGIRNFLAVCNVVKAFRKTRILQIGPRPFDFWFTMCNEGELLERFHIQLSPIPLPELTEEMRNAKEEGGKVKEVMAYCREHFRILIKEEELENVAALKVAIRNLADRYGCNAAAIQCWNALQGEIGIMPCAANSLLNEEGFPVVCETDIHGAITAILVEAAGMGEAKHGEMTLCRFDGDNGEYSLLLGNAKGIDGPYTKGTYVWVEVKNLKRLEAKIVEGPYIHHCVGIHKDVVPVLYEACKYLGIKPDLYDDVEEEVRAYIRGE